MVNKVQSFTIAFIYETTHLIFIKAVLKIHFDGCLLLLAISLYIYIYSIYDIIALRKK